SAHELPNQHVIHCLGPVYGVDEPSDRLLAECFRNALLLADRHKLTSIAFPAISTGVFGYPLQNAAAVAMKAVSDTLAELNSVRLVRFVLFSDEDRKVFEQALELESGLSGR
ncbi:MAG TPA: RNase III inhibitor, partial [Marinobacter adhaerens]|nr:RNase III inhibitor [Marinobacter adhaerens]